MDFRYFCLCVMHIAFERIVVHFDCDEGTRRYHRASRVCNSFIYFASAIVFSSAVIYFFLCASNKNKKEMRRNLTKSISDTKCHFKAEKKKKKTHFKFEHTMDWVWDDCEAKPYTHIRIYINYVLYVATYIVHVKPIWCCCCCCCYLAA